jgi:hypothetical protein
MASNETPTPSPLTTDPGSTLPPPYERKGIFRFLELPREIRDMIYAEVADPTYTLDTPLANTVSYMRTKSSIENYQQHTSNSHASNSGTSPNDNNNPNDTTTDKPTTNPNNPPDNQNDLDDHSRPALSLNNIRLPPLAQTTRQIRREYLAAHFVTQTFTLPIAVCALEAPHPAPRFCNAVIHYCPITRQYASPAARRHAEFLESPLSLMNGERAVLRHQHFKVTVLVDYNHTTTRPLYTLRPHGRRNRNTVRVEWEGFIDVFFRKGVLSVEGSLVAPAEEAVRGTITAERARRAFEGLKAELERTCAGGRSRATHTTAPCGGGFEVWKEDDPMECPPNSPVLAAAGLGKS